MQLPGVLPVTGTQFKLEKNKNRREKPNEKDQEVRVTK
jgi:hypothetical protein